MNEKYDYLNYKKLRNQYNTNEEAYNCGGYALGTYNWYLPYGCNEEREVVINELIEDGYEKEEIYSYILSKDVDFMLEDFQDRLRIIQDEDQIGNNEVVIAYRIFIEFYYDDNGLICEHTDFHYRVKQGKNWFEKNGDGPIHKIKETDINKPWVAACGTYDSDVILLALKK